MNDIEHLLYKNYLVEQEMMDHLAVIKIKSSGVLTEATRVQLNEDVKDIVMTAIRKIMANIQEVWNKFKSTITSEVDLKRIAPYEKYFETNYMMNVKGFPVPNMQEYNKMMEVNVPAFQESMVDDLNGSGDFTKKFFGYFYSDDKEKTLKSVAEDKIFESSDKEEVAVGKEIIKRYVDFIKNYKKKADEIANDIKNLNNSSRSIENLLNQSVNETVDLISTIQYYFTEADDDKEKASFSSANPEDKKAEEEEKNTEESGKKKEKKPDLTKQINEYFKVCNGVLSVKLNVTNRVRSSATRIVTEFGKAQAEKGNDGNTTTEKKPEKEPESNSGGGAATVEV